MAAGDSDEPTAEDAAENIRNRHFPLSRSQQERSHAFAHSDEEAEWIDDAKLLNGDDMIEPSEASFANHRATRRTRMHRRDRMGLTGKFQR